MSEISKPNYQYIWSSGGSLVAPSNTKIQTGWTAEVPPYQWENWSQNRQDQAIAHVLQHGISVWDVTTEYQANKSYVTGSDGSIYKCLITTVGINPAGDVSGTWTKNFVQSATETQAGILSIATLAQSQAWTEDTAALTPKKLADALKGSNQSLAGNGYQKLPGGLIIQWATVSVSAVGTAFSFPVTFPTSLYTIANSDGSSSCIIYGFASRTTSGATAFARDPQTGGSLTTGATTYIAIGR